MIRWLTIDKISICCVQFTVHVFLLTEHQRGLSPWMFGWIPNIGMPKCKHIKMWAYQFFSTKTLASLEYHWLGGLFLGFQPNVCQNLYIYLYFSMLEFKQRINQTLSSLREVEFELRCLELVQETLNQCKVALRYIYWV